MYLLFPKPDWNIEIIVKTIKRKYKKRKKQAIKIGEGKISPIISLTLFHPCSLKICNNYMHSCGYKYEVKVRCLEMILELMMVFNHCGKKDILMVAIGIQRVSIAL